LTVRILQEHAKGFFRKLERFPVADDQLNAVWQRAGFEDINRLWQNGVGHKKNIGFFTRFGAFIFFVVKHVHGLSGCGAFVQQTGIGDGQSGQVTNHRLEIEQAFEAALRDFRLVGRVLGVPTRIAEQVAQNDRWRNRT